MIIDGMHYSEECSCQNCREITTRHRINRRVLEKETMNEPQLSEEMEKRFNEQFAHLSVLIDQALSYTYVDSKNMGELKIKDIKHFLATALEEQRKQVLDEVEKLVGDIYDGSDWHTGRHALVDELRTKLNQLKGEK